MISVEDVEGFLTRLPRRSVDLAILDPPYWKTVNEKWDFQWRTLEDYLRWCKQWLSASFPKMRWGGTMYLFGFFRVLAYLVPILESLGFEVRQQIVLRKGMKVIAGRNTKPYRMLPVETESVLLLVKNSRPITRRLLLLAKAHTKLSASAINEVLGVATNGGGMWSIYTGENVMGQVPTKEAWHDLSKLLGITTSYNRLGQTFNIEPGLTDVWEFDFSIPGRIHRTQKPLKLIERLIRLSSNEGDLVIDPFSGSGTTAVACRNLRRSFLGCDTDPVMVKKAEERILVGEKRKNKSPKSLKVFS